MDNLESQTYEIFEKDPVKYSQYQKVSSWAKPKFASWADAALGESMTAQIPAQ